MNIKTTTVTGILRLASARIERRYDYLRIKRETLRADIMNRWPVELYGMRWESKYEKRSKDLSAEIKRCRLAIYGLSNLINELEQNLEEYKNV